MRACAAAPELLEVYLERIARLDSQLRCYRVVLADRARRAQVTVGQHARLCGRAGEGEIVHRRSVSRGSAGPARPHKRACWPTVT
ncbi:hypothetical protein MAHJHV47_45430 [Mycobacterium avium subsp. hominissuis]